MVTEQDLDRAAAILRSGGLVALPTETVYGLAADALNPAAVARIYQLKRRPATSPLIVHVASIGMARELAAVWPPEAESLARRFWPGPLTLVVNKQPRVPAIVTAGLSTVGLRMPSHPVALEVIRRAGTPIAAPSANRFTEISPTTAEHVRRSLGPGIDLILDGGPCSIGIESTVLSLASPRPTLLRPGAVTQPQIEDALGQALEIGGGKLEGAHPSPGMHERHYSPRTPAFLALGAELPPGRGAYVQWNRERAAALVIPLPSDPAGYARQLYGALHQADQAGLDWIAIEPPPEGAEWAGVRDRISRAVQANAGPALPATRRG